jgi:hypothetical protein
VIGQIAELADSGGNRAAAASSSGASNSDDQTPSLASPQASE